jgi:hypothetical protein
MKQRHRVKFYFHALTLSLANRAILSAYWHYWLMSFLHFSLMSARAWRCSRLPHGPVLMGQRMLGCSSNVGSRSPERRKWNEKPLEVTSIKSKKR